MTTIDELVARGRVERVEPDSRLALAMLAEANRHLTSAATIAAQDPNGAYHLLYDAARKAVWAHMLANGYRPTSAAGAHAAVAAYAVEALPLAAGAEQLDRMRRTRNRSEYGSAYFSARVVDVDLAHARRIVAAVEAALKARD